MRPLVVVFVALALAGCTVFERPAPAMPYYQEVLSGAPFTDLVVEVDHAPGRAPSKAATDHLLAQLREVTSKERVTLRVEETLADSPDKKWTADELVALEKETRSTAHAPPVALLHVLYVAGEYANGSAGGITVSGPVLGPAVVFLDTLREITALGQPLPLPDQGVVELERATLLHEAGHAMGLVDNGLPQVRDREDPEHPGHTKNEGSVMYWKAESVDAMRDFLLQEDRIPQEFDADDRADMRAAGGR